MSEVLKVKINVEKIDKTKLFNGKKGTYLDIILIPTPDNQYENTHMAVQGVTKEEREAGIRGEILGNAELASNPAERPKDADLERQQAEENIPVGADDPVPF